MKRVSQCDLQPDAESECLPTKASKAPRSLKPRLSRDTEPEREAGVPHFSFPPGPDCVESMLAWPDRVLPSLPLGFSRELSKKVSAGVCFSEDYAGYGSGAIAAQHLATGLQKHGFDIGIGFQCLRASDMDPVCRFALRMHSGQVAPCCPMGDMMRRSPPDIAKKLRDVSDWAQGVIKERIMAGENETYVHRTVGDALIAKACAALEGVRQ